MPEGSEVLLNILIACTNCLESELRTARNVAGYCRSMGNMRSSEIFLGVKKQRACLSRVSEVRLMMQLSSNLDTVFGGDFICDRAENMEVSTEMGMCKLLH